MTEGGFASIRPVARCRIMVTRHGLAWYAARPMTRDCVAAWCRQTFATDPLPEILPPNGAVLSGSNLDDLRLFTTFVIFGAHQPTAVNESEQPANAMRG